MDQPQPGFGRRDRRLDPHEGWGGEELCGPYFLTFFCLSVDETGSRRLDPLLGLGGGGFGKPGPWDRFVDLGPTVTIAVFFKTEHDSIRSMMLGQSVSPSPPLGLRGPDSRRGGLPDLFYPIRAWPPLPFFFFSWGCVPAERHLTRSLSPAFDPQGWPGHATPQDFPQRLPHISPPPNVRGGLSSASAGRRVSLCQLSDPPFTTQK